MHDHRLEDRHHRRGFPLSFGHRHLLLGHPAPAEESSPPHGRPAGPESGPRRDFRVPHIRAAIGVGALCAPGTTVLIPDGATSRPASAASQRHVPVPRRTSHRRGLRLTRHQPRVHACSPVRSSPACGRPDGTGRPWAFPRASHPADQEPDDARQGRDRPSSTDLELHAQLTSVDLQSGSSLVMCDLVSHVA